ncbi:hypothetical protein [Trichlorobacter ammonificans]|uniref:Uncharacterized protein n=1 Tax=Trichlorobacter ammonificans TaxID=2916410 RepID=A0ABN8HLH7_9BACT|nr:hypothetical protein [Trichlorobacter ammonificans]CAH2032423.1 conserved exported protein of unknown function [Trichlorobacter ammonificans]
MTYRVGFCAAGLLLGLLTTDAVANNKAAIVQEIGRYQLFQGSYTTFDLKRKETYVHQGVFLLDTATGDVKRYINKIDVEGRYIETWLPTDLSGVDKGRPAQERKP